MSETNFSYMHITEDIGEMIVKYRKLNGISQTYLAMEIGISKQGLLKIEKGQASPRANTIKKILEALCITPNQLFGVEEIKDNNRSIIKKLREVQE